MRIEKGFTLLEVMMALALLALGMVTAINSVSESTWKASYLKQKTLASWTAQNQIILHRAKRKWSANGNLQGTVEMANTNWTWKMKVTKTDDPSIKRLDVEVFLGAEEHTSATAIGFIANL